ncbi:hypothetical protein ACN9JF_11725 [Pseudoalteromonas lipolytica]|uniref:hypothetical protein n=1 Tax=Pseudoalteromonas lipolytica TaxID=570156 RepID=UPI003BA1B3EA
MYRFSVKQNTPDHKPFVVFFCFIAIILSFAYQQLFSQCLVFVSSFIIGVISYKKVTQLQPTHGAIILEQSQLRFLNNRVQMQGAISPKSKIFSNFVVIKLAGFYKSHWLIITAASVDEVSFSRLKRAIIAVQQPTSV